MRLLASVPFTERKHWETCGINNHHRETAPRGTSDFFEATECDEATLFASFCTHSSSPFHLSEMLKMVTQLQESVHMMTIYGALLTQLHYTDVCFREENADCSSCEAVANGLCTLQVYVLELTVRSICGQGKARV